MIVDDEQIIREALSELIDYRSIGYELIATAKNGMEAYDIIQDEYPDVVITDIRMPFLNGLELIEQSIKSDSRITFILLSGYSEFEYAKQAMKYGVRHYLLKPTDKQELIDTLIAIRQERKQEQDKQQKAQFQLIKSLRPSLEQSFLIEALAYQDNFPSVYRKYKPLLSWPDTGTSACICTFVEMAYMKNFAADAKRILAGCQAALLFSPIYVKNCLVLIFPDLSLNCQEDIRSHLETLHYPKQTVSFEVRFLHAVSTEELFQNLLLKISRFQQISLLDSKNTVYEIRNHPAAPWRISHLSALLANAADVRQAASVLDSFFTEPMPLDTARNIALELFLKSSSENEHHFADTAGDFFRSLYCCTTIKEVQNLTHVVLLQDHARNQEEKNNANIALLKSYIDEHLNSENLSLKWLAENYLFISIGYLSKLFIKEEGIRFSDYLNQRRIEEAKRLMGLYQDGNIKNIAAQVGFGNNPTYFSQVFKKYTGMTPTEYIDSVKTGGTGKTGGQI